MPRGRCSTGSRRRRATWSSGPRRRSDPRGSGRACTTGCSVSSRSPTTATSRTCCTPPSRIRPTTGSPRTSTGVEPTLDELEAAGLVLAIVSNFEVWLEDLLERLGMRDRFGVRVISGIEGIEKPDPRIFQLALERLSLDPADAMYVGDNPEFDV